MDRMDEQPHRFHEGQRVKLKGDGQDALYAYNASGTQGWVRRMRHDRYGYPTIFIEWDKDHWAYNGEPDKWVLEAHFDPVEEKKMSEGPKKFTLPDGVTPEDFANAMAAFLAAQCGEDEKSVDTSEPSVEDRFQQAVEETHEILKASDAFILIAVAREYKDGSPRPIMIPLSAQFYKTEASGVLAELQLSKLAQFAHEELGLDRVRELLDDEGEQ